MKLNKAHIETLKGQLRKAEAVGKKSLKAGVSALGKTTEAVKNNPVESALFTLLAAGLVKRTRSRKGTSLEQSKKD